MKRLVSAAPALLPLLLASCQLLPPAGMAPTLPADGPPATSISAESAAAIETAGAIARGEVGNAISGTIELPINLKTLARFTEGSPPVTLHAFRVTGPLIREATAAVFWKDEHTIGYVVDDVPSDVSIVLAATIEPGVVIRTIVPKASRAHPARGQRIDLTSETIVLKSYQLGIIPPVGLGGTAEVLRQGGLDPAVAAEANDTAAAALTGLAETSWGRDLTEVGEAVAALHNLVQAQRKVAGDLAAAGGGTDSTATTDVYAASLAAGETLSKLETHVDERVKADGLPADAEALLAEAGMALQRAIASDRPKATTLLETSGVYNLAQVIKAPFPYKKYYRQPSQSFLADLYERVGFLSTANTGFRNPNGAPFSEAEIDAAFSKGQGPYRTICPQVNLQGVTNCRYTTNPLDRSQEVLLTRSTDFLATKLKELEAAVDRAITTQGSAEHWASPIEHPAIARVLSEHPAIVNFIADDVMNWRTPIGTWRLRLLQDVGAVGASDFLGNGGFPLIYDSEMFIALPGKQQHFDYTAPIYSGAFTGTLSIWMPNNELPIDGAGEIAENLTNFSLKFYWDEASRTLTEGEIRGVRRDYHDGSLRLDYSAAFDANMVENNRVLGFWYNKDERLAGRFEMIRGTARFTIKPEPPKKQPQEDNQ